MKWLNRQKKRVQTIFAGWTPHFRHLQVQPCDFIAAVNSESSPEVGGGRGWWKPWGWDSGIHKDPKTIRIWGLIKHHHPSIRVKMILLPKSCAQRSTTKWLMWNIWWNRSKTLCLFAAAFGQERLSRNKLYRFFWENYLVTSQELAETELDTGNRSLPSGTPAFLVHFRSSTWDGFFEFDLMCFSNSSPSDKMQESWTFFSPSPFKAMISELQQRTVVRLRILRFTPVFQVRFGLVNSPGGLRHLIEEVEVSTRRELPHFSVYYAILV